MGFLSKFENKMEDSIEGAAGMVGASGLSPVQITKKAEKQMRREKIVGAGKQYAPTLYTVLVSPVDDAKLSRYYPTLAGETETYLLARARELGYAMDGHPLVRFLEDPELKKGKFDVVAEMVASAIVEQLRDDEMQRYGLPTNGARRAGARAAAHSAAAGAGHGAYDEGAGAQANMQPLPNLQKAQRAASNTPPQQRVYGNNAAEYADSYGEAYSVRTSARAYDAPPSNESAHAAGYDDAYDDSHAYGGNGGFAAKQAARLQHDVEQANRLQREMEQYNQVQPFESPIVTVHEMDDPDGAFARSGSLDGVAEEPEGFEGLDVMADGSPASSGAPSSVRRSTRGDEAAAAARAAAPAQVAPARTSHGAGVDALFGGADQQAMQSAGTVDIRDQYAPAAPEAYLYDEARDVAYELTGFPQRIGRESSNDIVVPDINISRSHAQIQREANGAWVITDLGSTNGLYINGRKIGQAPLRDADMITLGTTTLEFQLL